MVRSIFHHVDGIGTDHVIIDMSSLAFDESIPDRKHRAFIFLRNGAVKAELDFSHCSYQDKEEYLLMFLQGDVDITSKALAITWMDILAQDGNVNKQSILTNDEIHQFNADHKEYVDHIHQFINSLPLYAIYVFHDHQQNPIATSAFETSSFDQINLRNFTQVAMCPNFVLLLEPNPISDRQAVFISKLFTSKKHLYDMAMLMKKLPFINILALMLSGEQGHEDILRVMKGVAEGGDKHE